MALSFLFSLMGIGFVAGLFGSMLGLGGGIFVVPFLTTVLGVEIHQAIGTSLIGVIATSSAGASVYVKARLTNIRLAMVLETTTTVGAVIGGMVATALSADILSGLFAALLVYAAYSMGIRRQRESPGAMAQDGGAAVGTQEIALSSLAESYFDKSAKRTVSYQVRSIPAGLGASTIAGALSGLLGVGGGLVNVPLMSLIMGIPIRAATATSNYMVGITAAASAFIYYAHGHVVPSLVAPTVIGVFVGAQTGSRVAQRLNPTIIRRIFAIVLFVVAIQMITKALNVNL